MSDSLPLRFPKLHDFRDVEHTAIFYDKLTTYVNSFKDDTFAVAALIGLARRQCACH